MPSGPTRDLPPAVSGERRNLQTPERRLSYYAAGPASATYAPLLLIHSINAAGSASPIARTKPTRRAS
jgi:hypothetical protein